MDTDYRKIKVHPLFEPIKKLFEFMIFGHGFMMMPDFQRAFIARNPGAESIVNDYNKEVKLTIKGSEIHTNIQPYLVYAARVMAIAIFDFLQFSQYNKLLAQTDLFKFAKHIRNGAAHNNTFFFDPKSKQDLSVNPVKWRDKTIDNTLSGKTVVPDYANPFSLLYLMQDISREIELMENKKKADD